MKREACPVGVVLAAVFCLLGCRGSVGPDDPGGLGSFVAGTEVWTKSGLLPIEAIKAGTDVYALDVGSGQWSYRPVLEVLQHAYSGTMVSLQAGGKLLEVTAAHPFLVQGDFKSDYRPHIKVSPTTAWLAADQLRAGDTLLLKDGALADLTSVEKRSGDATVYDLNTSGQHTFAVDQQGIVVSDATISVSGLAFGGQGGGPMGGGCFPAGTLVWTRNGLMPIESVEVGMQVWARNMLTRRWAWEPVLLTQVHEYEGDFITIDVRDARFDTTGNHPLWIVSGEGLESRPIVQEVSYPQRGGGEPGRWVEARNLRPLDLLMDVEGTSRVVECVTSRYGAAEVYNLKVGMSHTYAVSAAGILVHNKGKTESAATPNTAAQPMTQPVLIVPPQQWNTEEYTKIGEQPFLSAMNNPLSTFSIDVDTASYANVRRYLQSGQMPPKDAVRIEEFINYFTYDYPQPQGDAPFSFAVELSECPWNQEHLLVHIGLQGKRLPVERLPPCNLVFLIDVSGSMDSPDKLPLLKEALAMLTSQMRSVDRVAIAVYAGAAGLVLPSTSGDEKQKILSAIDRLHAGGSTAGGAGIQLAYATAQRYFDPKGNNRVILATDGDFNVGVSSQGELVRIIEQKRDTGIYLTVLGFGTGNYKDSRMESLADSGNGNYAYIDTAMEAKKALVSQLAGTLFTIANDVKIQIEFNPAVVESYRLIGYENRALRTEEFEDDRRDAGDMGAGHTVTVLYELKMSQSAEQTKRELRYQSSEVQPGALTSNELMLLKVRYKNPGEERSVSMEEPILFDPKPLDRASFDLRWAAAVAAFAQILRDSTDKGAATYDLVLQLAEQSLGSDPEWYRKEFLGLVKTAQWLAK